MESIAVVIMHGCLAFAACMAMLAGDAAQTTNARAALYKLRLFDFLQRASQQPLVKQLDAIPCVRVIAAYTQEELAQRRYMLTRSQTIVCLCAATLGAIAVVAFLAQSLVSVGICAMSLLAFLPMIANYIMHAKRDKVAHEMPDVFRILGMGLSSGQTLTQAIAYVGIHKKGEAGHAFQQASLQLRCGAGITDVLKGIAVMLHAPGVKFLVTALAISQRTGSPLRNLFRQSAKLVEQQEQFKRLLRVKTAQVRLSVRVVASLPVVLICILSVLSVDFQKGLTRPLGVGCLICAAVLNAVALFIITQLMKGILHDDSSE